MGDLHYRIVEHMGGWAYKLGDSFSETFDSREDAYDAARRVAAEQHQPGDDVQVFYQDAAGRWVTEMVKGTDRPDADVVAD
ncbi:DUF2188 domain-containing protein [Chthonobacter albigriseus]|uniref:DUF2188 domain-containing protein n=1 Tax=Chthonobacter albigriseus TaxID=1683161 RepID=UPI0015EF92DA|nr:DUF2188 domain-containing protein [Chthonobacter albigriseus]